MNRKMVKVTIYSRPDCHLCEIAKERVENVRREAPFEVEEVDITSDSALRERYGERIPVVAVEGEEVCVYRVSERLLKRRVLEAYDRKGRVDMEAQGQDQGQPRTGVVGRIVGTFVSPGDTFASVRVSSSWVDWVVPWVIAAVFATVVAQRLTPIAMHESMEQQRERIQENTGLSEEQRKEALAGIEKMESRMSTVTASFFIVTPLMTLIMLAILSGIYLGIANFLFGGTGAYVKVMAVAAYSGLITSLGGLIMFPLIVMKNTAKVSMGPALFFPPDMEHTWAYRLASGIDIFWIWNFAVASIGVGVVSGVAPKKIGAVVFAVYLVIVVGVAFFKNMFGG
ncbi:MAG: hypothetical protein A3F84_23775 [Candidatus Handelsmanbacteria bacterium RIFCSPLOWO2_12_FULL_64_10]|uniref:Yip1 domain-containing protein n=1 Tax=Handelsmanbacteria sp. (strain RIFCSPLOWO2_12_FULL_64_10) TaxID=1817868 RepID=A0A1F6CBB3_HANXR|nr:MAG: hypothetical protein A3F84_23775 [Candidatus Handelsmanbacteria bacterium RIFCSPLOWO2_12_FULL_64_10]